MRKMSSLLCVGLLLAAAGCGGSGSDQEDIADKLIESGKDEGVTFDEDCVRDASAKFSDDDAKLILDNINETNAPNLSPEGENLLLEIFSCADLGDISIPDISIPDISMPDISMPDISMPDISIPNVSVDPDALNAAIDQVIANLPDNVDKDCVRDALSDVDPADLASGQAPEMASAMVSCLSGG